MKEFIKKTCCCFIFAIVVLSQSCVHNINGWAMSLNTKMDTPVILNLRNYEQDNPDFFKQSEKLVRGHLVQNGGEEYGYFRVVYYSSSADTVLQSSLGMLIHGLFGFALIPLGFPTASEKFSLRAYLYIFDSQGNLVKEYNESDSFTHVAGLYYGYNPTRRAARRFSKMYGKIFELAMLHSDEINEALRKAGPITEENKKAGKEAIGAFFRKQIDRSRVVVKTRSESYAPSTSSSSSSQETSSFSASALNGGLEVGKFYCVQMPNLKFSMSMGVVTIYDGYQAIAMGNASISGKDMIVNFYFGTGPIGEKLKGQSMAYIIDDSKHFRSAVANESWTYQGAF